MNIIEQINQLHEDDEHEKIIEIITKIPSDKMNAELFSLLARAYNNTGNYDKALSNLMYIREEGINDALWNFRVGYAYYYKGYMKNAEMYFKKAYDLGDKDAYNFYMIFSENKDDGINFEERVNKFWKWFYENEKIISDYIDKKSSMSSDEVIEFVSNGVSLISNNLSFEFGGNYEFTFTVEGKEYLFYLTPRIVSAMPDKLKGKWKFFPYMQNNNVENFNFNMYDNNLSFKEILVSAEFDADSKLFNCKFYNEKLNKLEENDVYNVFYKMLDISIGENISHLYIGDCFKSDKKLDDMIDLTKLYDFIINTLKNINEDKEIILDPINRFTVYQFKYNSQADRVLYREDIIIGNTCYMELIYDYIHYNVNSIVNISKMGARAAYLVYYISDNKDNNFDSEMILNERNKITDELESVMGKKGSGEEIGIILGNALGVTCAYIDLLLYNQDEFIKRAKEVLKNYNYEFRLFKFHKYDTIAKMTEIFNSEF